MARPRGFDLKPWAGSFAIDYPIDIDTVSQAAAGHREFCR